MDDGVSRDSVLPGKHILTQFMLSNALVLSRLESVPPSSIFLNKMKAKGISLVIGNVTVWGLRATHFGKDSLTEKDEVKVRVKEKHGYRDVVAMFDARKELLEIVDLNVLVHEPFQVEVYLGSNSAHSLRGSAVVLVVMMIIVPLCLFCCIAGVAAKKFKWCRSQERSYVEFGDGSERLDTGDSVL